MYCIKEKISVMTLLIMTSCFSLSLSQPTTIDLDICRENTVLQHISATLNMLAKEMMAFRTTLTDFQKQNLKRFTVLDNNLAELNQSSFNMTSILSDSISNLNTSFKDTLNDFQEQSSIRNAATENGMEQLKTQVSSVMNQLSENISTLNTSWAQTVSGLNEQDLNIAKETGRSVKDLNRLFSNLTAHMSEKVSSVNSQLNVSFQTGIVNLTSTLEDSIFVAQNSIIDSLKETLGSPIVYQTLELVGHIRNTSERIEVETGQNFEALMEVVRNISHRQDNFCSNPNEQIVQGAFRPQIGNLRLTNDDKCNSGRVELYYKGKWGTVCDDGWSSLNTKVVCRQLGYNRGTRKTANQVSATGVSIVLDDVACKGTEMHIMLCKTNTFGLHNCDHSEDVWVSCT